MKGMTKMMMTQKALEQENTNDRNVGGRPVDDRGGKVYERPMENAYGGSRETYSPENRRDSRGRYAPRNEMDDRYDGGYNRMPERSYPTENYESNYRMGHDGGWVVKPIEERMNDNYGPENRRDRMGRYAPRNEEAGNWMPPYWENRTDDERYRLNEDGGRMIGFDGEYDGGQYRSMAGGKPYSSEHRMGHAMLMEKKVGRLDQKTAKEWVEKMGESFPMEKTMEAMKQRRCTCDPLEFWVICNAMKSDYHRTAIKYGMDKLDFYADLAMDWLEDDDANPNKAMLYYMYIVAK